MWWPLLLSTLAGLSTSIGGLIAINLSPDESTLAFLLGSAVGVMSTVSIAELWWHKALAHGWLGITTAVAAGGVLFAVLDPLLPKPVESLQEKDSFQVRSSGSNSGGGVTSSRPCTSTRVRAPPD